MELKKLASETLDIIREAGSYIRKSINGKVNIETKSMHNFVTEIDKNSEKFLVDNLKKLLPESGFLTEENTANIQGREYTWIIDPLDGTTNFIHGLFPVAISVALQKQGKTVLGVVYEVGNDEMFYAIEDDFAYLNGKKITVTSTLKIRDSLLATGFPYYDYKYLDGFMESLKYFMQHSHGLRRLGSAATDLAYVACGRFDGFYEYSLSPWDVAAGAFIVSKAGGKVADFNGGDNFIYGREIIASNPFIFNEFLNIVQKLIKS